eukprot:74465_1
MSWRPKKLEVVETATQYHYTIYANLSTIQQVLTITVTDTITQNQWRQQFVQMNFENINLYKVTKILIDAIKPLNITNRCKIIIYSNYCYLTIDNGKVLPSFALPLTTLDYSNNYSNNY